MKPVKQSNRNDPANGVYGDCYRASIASLLELPLDKVPHVYFDGAAPDVVAERLNKWFHSKSLTLLQFAFLEDPREHVMPLMNPGIYYLLTGTSANGTGHVVVCLDDLVVHDPGLDDPGIVGPYVPDDGEPYYVVEIVGVGLHQA